MFTTKMAIPVITSVPTYLARRLNPTDPKTSAVEEVAKRQCTHEVKALFHRWEEESDLDSQQILECVSEAIDEYYEEDTIEFESDISLEEEETDGVDLGGAEEGS